jgi:predicted house-cleaning NTP pyrophosphatase (Maf/HAM1 superfamily)
MSKCDVVLASKSPRRKEIFELMQINCRIIGAEFEENLDKASFATPGDYCATNAMHKVVTQQLRLLMMCSCTRNLQ